MSRSNSLSILPVIAIALAAPLAGCGNPAQQTPQEMVAKPDDMPMPDGSKAKMAAIKLFPGSTMRQSIKIMPHEADDMIDFSFMSPAPPAQVRDWFASELGQQGYKLTAKDNSLIGTDGSGKPFRLDLVAAPGGAMGVISKG